MSSLVLMLTTYCVHDNSPRLLILIAVCLLSGINILRSKDFQLRQVVYLFVFCFLGTVPFFQGLLGISIWFSGIDDSVYLINGVLVLLFLLGFSAIKGDRGEIRTVLNARFPKLVISIMLIATLMLTLNYVVRYKGLGYILLSRNSFEEITFYSNNTVHNLIEMFSRVSIWSFACLVLVKKRKNNSRLLGLVFRCLIICLLVVAPPHIIPRYQAMMLYGALLFFWKEAFFRERMGIVLLFILFLVYPLAGILRSGNDSQIDLAFTILNTGSFDAFEMGAAGVQYLSENELSYGYQLLGGLFFFVPRILWSSKPIGTGQLIAEESDLYFTNLAFPFYAEGYFNFGYLGVFFFGVILALIVRNLQRCRNNVYMTPMYFASFGMLVFIMRGDFISTTAYSLSIYFIYRIYLRSFRWMGF